jgi:hypothetical protein
MGNHARPHPQTAVAGRKAGPRAGRLAQRRLSHATAAVVDREEPAAGLRGSAAGLPPAHLVAARVPAVLPHHRVDCHVSVAQRVVKPQQAVAPVDVEVLCGTGNASRDVDKDGVGERIRLEAHSIRGMGLQQRAGQQCQEDAQGAAGGCSQALCKPARRRSQRRLVPRCGTAAPTRKPATMWRT